MLCDHLGSNGSVILLRAVAIASSSSSLLFCFCDELVFRITRLYSEKLKRKRKDAVELAITIKR